MGCVDEIKSYLASWANFFNAYAEQFIFLAIIFCDNIAYFFVQPMFAITLPKRFPVSNVELAVMTGAFALGMAFAGPMYGFIGDLVGRKIPLLFSLFCAGIAYAAYAFAHTAQQMIVFRLIHGITNGSMAMAVTLVLELSPADKKGEASAIASTTQALALTFGPVVGGIVTSTFSFETACFLGLAGNWVIILVALVLWTIKPPSVFKKVYGESSADEGKETENPCTQTVNVFKKSPYLKWYVLGVFVNWGGMYVVATYIAKANQLFNGWSEADHGLFAGVGSSIAAFLGVPNKIIGYGEKHYTRQTTFRYCSYIIALTYFIPCLEYPTYPVIGRVQSWIFIYTLGMINIPLEFTTQALSQAIIVDEATPDIQGTMMGVFVFARVISEAVIPPICGIIISEGLYPPTKNGKRTSMLVMYLYAFCFKFCGALLFVEPKKDLVCREQSHLTTALLG